MELDTRLETRISRKEKRMAKKLAKEQGITTSQLMRKLLIQAWQFKLK